MTEPSESPHTSFRPISPKSRNTPTPEIQIETIVEGIKRAEGLLLSVSKGKLVKLSDVEYLIEIIQMNSIVSLFPLMMMLKSKLELDEQSITILEDLKESIKINDSILCLRHAHDHTNDYIIKRKIRVILTSTEKECNEILLSESKQIDDYLIILKSEAERRILSKLYEVAKYLTTYRMNKRAVILKLVEIIVKILSDDTTLGTESLEIDNNSDVT